MESTWIQIENLDSNKVISNNKKIQLINGKLASTEYSNICMSAMKLPGGNTLVRFLKHLHNVIKHSNDAGGAHSQRNANHANTNRQVHTSITLPDFDPWTSTYRRCMFTGTHTTNCVIQKTAFKILWEVAPEAIKKFIAARNALYPRGPPNPDGKQRRYQRDKHTGYPEKPATEQPLPMQYDTNDCKMLITSQDGRDASSNESEQSDGTYGNGEESEDEDKQKLTALMRIINMARQSGWEDQKNERQAFNTVTVRAHLEYEERFIGTIGSERPNYIISNSSADMYVIGGHGWTILDMDPVCTANLVAFDANKMHKPNCPIVTTVTKVRTQTGEEILWVV